MNRVMKIVGFFALAALVSFNVYALSRYIVNANVEFTVSGTSTLHDWHMVTKSAKGSADIITDNGFVKQVNSLKIDVPVETLKSGKSGMDDNAYKALETKNHPNIHFDLKKVENMRTSGDKVIMMAHGDLTIAGATRPVSFNVISKVSGDDIYFAGKTELKMTNFEVDPPTAVMGTIKTGDDISVKFNVKFKQD